MADKRLEELRTSDMSESTVNVELVEWLKKHGMNVLLVFLLAILSVVGIQWWQDRKAAHIDEAWASFQGVDTVASLEGVANEYGDVGAIREVSLLSAADIHLQTLYRDLSQLEPDTDEENADAAPPERPLTPEERTDLLEKLERLYTMVRDSAADVDGKELFELKAMFGLAAVAEMRGDLDRAEALYAEIEQTAETTYPQLAELATKRQESLVTAATPVDFPARDDVQAMIRAETGATEVIPPSFQNEPAGPQMPELNESDETTGAGDAVEGDGTEEPTTGGGEENEPATDEPVEEPASSGGGDGGNGGG